MLLEHGPLGRNDSHHDILIYGLDEKLHLLSEELDLPQLPKLIP